MPAPKITPDDFAKILPKICKADTSSDQNGWSADNPLWGHCAIVSLSAKTLFGGKILRGQLGGFVQFAHLRTHYWNRLSADDIIDFTAPQFGGNRPEMLPEEKTTEYVLYDPETKKIRTGTMSRYRLFVFRLIRELNPDAPIINDPNWQMCIASALESLCQKMRFGCVIKYQSDVIYRGANQPIAPLKSMCDPKCIRFGIQSRTESMIGACGHAEELGIWDIMKRGMDPKKCDLYVAGLWSDGFPSLKDSADFTCLRCAVQMHLAGIKTIYTPTKTEWLALTAEEAVETAKAYALKLKVI
jgi:deoxycytidylate deaminase